MRIGLWIAKPPEDVVRIGRGEFIAIGGSERDLHIGDRYGLIAIVGDDEENWQIIVRAEIDGEDFGFLGGIVRIGCYGNFVIRMVVMRRVSLCRLGCGFYKIFGRESGRE